MHLDLPHLTTVYATLLSAICFIDEASLVHWSLSYQSTISTALKGTTKHMQWTTHVVAVENIDRFLCAFKGFFTNLNARENYMSTRCKCKASRTSINTMALLTMWTCNLTDSCSPFILTSANGGSILLQRFSSKARSCSGEHCPIQPSCFTFSRSSLVFEVED